MTKYPLKMALLCSSQNQAYLDIQVNGQTVDYRLIVTYTHKSFDKSEDVPQLQIHAITYEDQGPHKPSKVIIAKEPHKAIHLNNLKAMIEFLDDLGITTNDMWLPVESEGQS